MAIYYVDPVNGNDSNDGLSWGTAYKTLINGPSFARLGQTDSDEIRVAKSPDPVSIGNVEWTNDSPTFEIPQLTNVIVDQGKSGWTQTAGTLTYTGSYFRTPGNALQIAMSAVNGKSAHKALAAPLDLSAASRLTFWVNFGTGVNYTASCPVQIDLCSDTTGNTPVVRCTLPRYFYPPNYWVPITIVADAGYDFTNATAIQSITIRTSAAVTNTIRFDNFVVARAATDATSLVLTDMIAKNDGTRQYWPVMGFDGTGTTVIIRPTSPSFATIGTYAAAQHVYVSANGTETVSTIKRWGFVTATDVPATGTSSAVNAINYTNDANWPATKTYIGGVNPATDLVDGETWFDGITGYGYGLTQTNSRTSTYQIDNLSVIRYYYNHALDIGSNVTITNTSSVLPAVGIWQLSGSLSTSTLHRNVVNGFSLHMPWVICGQSSLNHCFVLNGENVSNFSWNKTPQITVDNAYLSNNAFGLGGLKARFNSSGTIVTTNGIVLKSTNNTFGTATDGTYIINVNNIFSSILSTNNGFINIQTRETPRGDNTIINITGSIGPGINRTGFSSMSLFRFDASVDKITLNGNNNGFGTHVASPLYAHSYGLMSCVGTATDVNMIVRNYNTSRMNSVVNTGFSQGLSGSVTFANYNLTPGDNRVYVLPVATGTNLQSGTAYWRMQTSTTFNGGSALEYVWSSTNGDQGTMRGEGPSIYKLATAALTGGSLCTISAHMQRTLSNIAAELVVAVDGVFHRVPLTQTNAWEQITVSFTPSSNTTAVVSIESFIAVPTSSAVSLFVDNLQITQV